MQGFFNAQSLGDWFSKAKLLIDLLLVAWAVAIVDFLILPGFVTEILSLKPRRISGIPGIVFSSLVHSDWEHLLGNSAYYLILGGMIVFRDASDLPIVTLMSVLIEGTANWLIGRSSRLLGASGVVFSYLGFILALGYLYQDRLAIVFLAVVLLSLFFGHLWVVPTFTGDKRWDFGQIMWGIFPQAPGISWEGHLFGFLGGIWTATRLNDLHIFFKPVFDWLTNFLQWSS